jgi:hypothetical protein
MLKSRWGQSTQFWKGITQGHFALNFLFIPSIGSEEEDQETEANF